MDAGWARSANEFHLQVTLSSAGRADLERAKELLSAALSGASWAAIIERLAREFVERTDPLLKPARKERENESRPNRHRRNPAAIRRCVGLQRAEGRFEFVDREMGRRCEARARISKLITSSLGRWAAGARWRICVVFAGRPIGCSRGRCLAKGPGCRSARSVRAKGQFLGPGRHPHKTHGIWKDPSRLSWQAL
jgi:hypothetical protein